MKKFFALLCLCLAAIVAAVCANSCQKPVEEIDTGLSINGKAVPFQSVVISFNDEEKLPLNFVDQFNAEVNHPEKNDE